MTKASDNVFPKLIGSEGAAPATPAAATAILYVKADGLWYSKDDAGVETLVSGGVATGIPATIVDVKGDLIVATAADTVARLAAGANDTVLIAASGEATGLKWGAPLGVWTDYTPTWANGGTTTLGNGTLVGRYKALDSKTYIIHITLTWGSTTSVTGAGAWTFTLPAGLTSAASRYQILAGYILDSGTDNKPAVGTVGSSATTIAQVIPEGGNTVTGTSPQTWATGDVLALSGEIEVA